MDFRPISPETQEKVQRRRSISDFRSPESHPRPLRRNPDLWPKNIRPYSGSQRASLKTDTQMEASPLTMTPIGIESNLEALKKDGKVKSIGLQDAVPRLKNEKIAKLAEEVGEGKYAYKITIKDGSNPEVSSIRFYEKPGAMAQEWGLNRSAIVIMNKNGKYTSKSFKIEPLKPDETIAELEKKKSDPDRMSTRGKIEAIAKEVIRERLKNSSVYEDPEYYYVGDLAGAEEEFGKGNAQKVEDTGKAYRLREQWINTKAKKARVYRTGDNRICIASDQDEAKKLLESGMIYEVTYANDALIRLERENKAFKTLLEQDLNLSEQPNIYAYEYTVKGNPCIIRTAVAPNQEGVEEKLFPENKELLGKKKTLDDPDVRPISYERALHWYLYKKVYGQEVNEKDISGCKITIDSKEQPLEMVTSAKELSDRLLQKRGIYIPTTDLDQLWKLTGGASKVEVNHGSTKIELERLNPEQTLQKLEEIVAQTMDNIQETHQNIYGKPANPGNIGFMVKVGDTKLQKILGMKSDEEFFTAARLENEVRQHNGLSGEYRTAIATMESGAQHVLDLLGTRVEIRRPGLEKIGQELKKAQKELNESLAILTNRKSPFSKNPRAYQVVEVKVVNPNSNVGKIKLDGIDVVENIKRAQVSLDEFYGIKAEGDIKLENIGIGEEIKFTHDDGGYVVYERIPLNDAKTIKFGKNMKRGIEQLVGEYNAAVLGNELDAMGKSNIWHPTDMLKQQDGEKRKTKAKAKSILVGTKPIKDWKTAFAANVKSAANDEGKFMLAEDEASMREAFPDKYIEPLSRGEAYKRLAALKNDQQAPEKIRDHRNKILGYGIKEASIRQDPAMKEVWDEMEKAGRIKYRLEQDRSGNTFALQMGYTIYYGNSRYEAAEQFHVSINVINGAKKKGRSGGVVMLPLESRHTQRLIEKGKIELVNDASQMWYVFQRTDSDGEKTWYVTDNREYNKTFEGEGTNLIAGQDGRMHISQNDLESIGVKEAEMVDHRTLGEKTWDGLKAAPDATSQAFQGLWKIIMGTKDGDDDSEKKPQLLDKDVDYSYLDPHQKIYQEDASQYGSNHPGIEV